MNAVDETPAHIPWTNTHQLDDPLEKHIVFGFRLLYKFKIFFKKYEQIYHKSMMDSH